MAFFGDYKFTKRQKNSKFPHCEISAVCLQIVLPIRSTFDLFSMKIHMVKLAHSIHMFIDTNHFFPHTNTIISRFTTCCMKSWKTFALLEKKKKNINKQYIHLHQQSSKTNKQDFCNNTEKKIMLCTYPHCEMYTLQHMNGTPYI